MPHRINATQDGLPISATRVQAASAVVLAMDWAAKGCLAIVIATADGRSLSLIEAKQERMDTLRQGRRLFA